MIAYLIVLSESDSFKINQTEKEGDLVWWNNKFLFHEIENKLY